MKTELDIIKELTESSDREKRLLATLGALYGKTIRKSRYGYTACKKSGSGDCSPRILIESSIERDTDHDTGIEYPRFFYFYSNKYGTPIREIIVEDVMTELKRVDTLLKA